MMLAPSSRTRPSRRTGAHPHEVRAYEWALICPVVLLTLTAHVAYGANKDVLGPILSSIESSALLIALTKMKFSQEIWAMRHSVRLVALGFVAAAYVGAYPLFFRDPNSLVDLSGVTIESLKLLGLGCMFLLGGLLGRRWRRSEMFLRLCGISLGIYAAYSIIAFKFAPDSILFGPRVMFFDRLTGTFGSANSAATLMGMGTVLNGAMALDPRSGRKSKTGEAFWGAAFVASALMCVAALLLTASRGGFISTLAGLSILVVYTLFGRRDAKIRPAAVIATLGGVAAVGVAAATTQLGQRLSGTTLNIDRFDIFKAHWPLVQSEPLLGLGAGNFPAANNLVIRPDNYGLLWNVRATHNVFIQWMEEAGTVSLVLMTIVIGFILLKTFAATSKKHSRPILGVAILAMSAVVLVHGLSDFGLQNPSIAAFWTVCLGIGFSLSQLQDESERQTSGKRRSVSSSQTAFQDRSRA